MTDRSTVAKEANEEGQIVGGTVVNEDGSMGSVPVDEGAKQDL